MKNKFLRVVIVIAAILGVAFLANGSVAWADSETVTDSGVVLSQNESSLPLANPKPGSVKPPPPEWTACAYGRYSVGGVVVLDIKKLKSGYCIKALLSAPTYLAKLIPGDFGKVLAHMLYMHIYYKGSLVYDMPAEDGDVEACYAIPPKKQAQMSFYDYYAVRFGKRTEPPTSWDLYDTRVDEANTAACALTQKSGVYTLVGK